MESITLYLGTCAMRNPGPRTGLNLLMKAPHETSAAYSSPIRSASEGQLYLRVHACRWAACVFKQAGRGESGEASRRGSKEAHSIADQVGRGSRTNQVPQEDMYSTASVPPVPVPWGFESEEYA